MQEIINKEFEDRNQRAGEYVRRKLQERKDKRVNARWELAGWAIVVIILVVVVLLGSIAIR